MKENIFIQTELVKLITKLKKLPSRVFFCKNKKETKLVTTLVKAGEFLGKSRATMHTYSSIGKNNLGNGLVWFEVKDTAKMMLDIAAKIEKLEDLKIALAVSKRKEKK